MRKMPESRQSVQNAIFCILCKMPFMALCAKCQICIFAYYAKCQMCIFAQFARMNKFCKLWKMLFCESSKSLSITIFCIIVRNLWMICKMMKIWCSCTNMRKFQKNIKTRNIAIYRHFTRKLNISEHLNLARYSALKSTNYRHFTRKLQFWWNSEKL